MYTPVCAMRTVHEPPDVARLSFETILARLTSESCGLSQNELFRLFCRTAQEFFDLSAVCCCSDSGQGAWRLLESAGHPTWGAQGEFVSSSAAESLAQAQRSRKAIVCQTSPQEVSRVQGEGGSFQVTVPVISQGDFRGAALAEWQSTQDFSEELLERLTLLGISFGGLLDHARLFEQVHSS